jgi:hypothetical membrane protein
LSYFLLGVVRTKALIVPVIAVVALAVAAAGAVAVLIGVMAAGAAAHQKYFAWMSIAAMARMMMVSQSVMRPPTCGA